MAAFAKPLGNVIRAARAVLPRLRRALGRDLVGSIHAPNQGERVGRQMLAAASRPSAVIGYNDLICYGVMRQVRACGVHIPKSCR